MINTHTNNKQESEQKTCADEVQGYFDSRMLDIRTLFNAEDNQTEELGSLNEYGLCIDFVEAGTFQDQREDFWRYQLSYGGGQEEFRVYKNGDVEFWYLDWFDGACIPVVGEDASIIKEIVSWKFPEVSQ